MRWTKREKEFLIENYSTTPTNVLLRCLVGKTATAIYTQAKKMGLQKSVEARGWACGRIKYREETPALADIICFYARRGVNIAITAKDVRCPVEQVADILERCRADGTYESYARQENKAIELLEHITVKKGERKKSDRGNLKYVIGDN